MRSNVNFIIMLIYEEAEVMSVKFNIHGGGVAINHDTIIVFTKDHVTI